MTCKEDRLPGYSGDDHATPTGTAKVPRALVLYWSAGWYSLTSEMIRLEWADDESKKFYKLGTERPKLRNVVVPVQDKVLM